MSMYEPYIEQIKKLISQGFNLKEINKKLKEHGVFGDYNTFYYFCQKRGIVPKVKRICKNCIYYDNYDVLETGGEIKVCNHPEHKNKINAKWIPRWCEDNFSERATAI